MSSERDATPALKAELLRRAPKVLFHGHSAGAILVPSAARRVSIHRSTAS
jgi:hypothetical protein